MLTSWSWASFPPQSLASIRAIILQREVLFGWALTHTTWRESSHVALIWFLAFSLEFPLSVPTIHFAFPWLLTPVKFYISGIPLSPIGFEFLESNKFSTTILEVVLCRTWSKHLWLVSIEATIGARILQRKVLFGQALTQQAAIHNCDWDNHCCRMYKMNFDCHIVFLV